MTHRAVVVSELAQHAEGEGQALTAQELLAKSKVLQASKLTWMQVSGALSHATLHVQWGKWAKRKEVEGEPLRYYYIKGAKPPVLGDKGRLIRTIVRRRKHKEQEAPVLQVYIPPPDGVPVPPPPYKLEISGEDLIVSKRLSRGQLKPILALLLGDPL